MTEETKAAKRSSIANGYVADLRKLTHDTGAMAMLRRGLGEAYGALEMYPYVYSLLPEDRAFLSEDSFLQIAALFALHPETCNNKSFGKSFRELWQTHNRRPSTETRFKALLAADREMVVTHLHSSVTMMKDKGIRIDYAGLLVDLNNWDHEDNFVQRGWAKSFWGTK
jgi:CRISPR system Cascade subunit CasB